MLEVKETCKLNLQYFEFTKENVPSTEYKQFRQFHRIILFQPGHQLIFTEGSKSNKSPSALVTSDTAY